MSVTGDQGLQQDVTTDLREMRAKLEEAQTEAASLRVLLALRTHQYEQAWQSEKRIAADSEAARAADDARAAEREAALIREAAVAREQEMARVSAVCAEAVARADAQTEAVRTVLGAVLASLRFLGLNRRRFQALVVQAGHEAPDEGPGAVRHAVLLAEARRVLGKGE